MKNIKIIKKERTIKNESKMDKVRKITIWNNRF